MLIWACYKQDYGSFCLFNDTEDAILCAMATRGWDGCMAVLHIIQQSGKKGMDYEL